MMVYIYQATIMSKQLSASVRPFLIAIYSNQEDVVSWGVENKGVGPAFIKETRLWINGEMYAEEYHKAFLESLFNKKVQYNYANLNTIDKSYISTIFKLEKFNSFACAYYPTV